MILYIFQCLFWDADASEKRNGKLPLFSKMIIYCIFIFLTLMMNIYRYQCLFMFYKYIIRCRLGYCEIDDWKREFSASRSQYEYKKVIERVEEIDWPSPPYKEKVKRCVAYLSILDVYFNVLYHPIMSDPAKNSMLFDDAKSFGLKKCVRKYITCMIRAYKCLEWAMGSNKIYSSVWEENIHALHGMLESI